MDTPLQNFELTVPGDPSSAAFFAAAAAMIPNSDITINNILANPTRIGFFSVLEKMGAGVELMNMRKEYAEWVGDVHIFSQPLNGIDITKDEYLPELVLSSTSLKKEKNNSKFIKNFTWHGSENWVSISEKFVSGEISDDLPF